MNVFPRLTVVLAFFWIAACTQLSNPPGQRSADVSSETFEQIQADLSALQDIVEQGSQTSDRQIAVSDDVPPKNDVAGLALSFGDRFVVGFAADTKPEHRKKLPEQREEDLVVRPANEFSVKSFVVSADGPVKDILTQIGEEPTIVNVFRVGIFLGSEGTNPFDAASDRQDFLGPWSTVTPEGILVPSEMRTKTLKELFKSPPSFEQLVKQAEKRRASASGKTKFPLPGNRPAQQASSQTFTVPEPEGPSWLRDGLARVEEMRRHYAEASGVRVSGFSATIGLVPSLTIDFEFDR